MEEAASWFSCGRLANIDGAVSVRYSGPPERVLHFYATDFAHAGVSLSVPARQLEDTLARPLVSLQTF